MYARTMSEPSNSLDIFFWKITGLLQTPYVVFGTCTYPKLVQSYRAVWFLVIIIYDSILYLNLGVTRT